ncbi:hypothetical protein N8835_03175 [Alphaproteobacteria bacterium]|nr:hypothetical protein [Alphaproteobacteria bacterium]
MDVLTYIVDIDGTICSDTMGDYSKCKPKKNRILEINNLYEKGHTIIYFTARGMGSTNNNQSKASEKYYEFTKKQLIGWGCKFTELYLGKPKGDLYIDDKAIRDNDFFKQ